MGSHRRHTARISLALRFGPAMGVPCRCCGSAPSACVQNCVLECGIVSRFVARRKPSGLSCTCETYGAHSPPPLPLLRGTVFSAWALRLVHGLLRSHPFASVG